MRRILFAVIVSGLLTATYSCGSSGRESGNKNSRTEEQIKQQEDGTIALNIEKASCYNNNQDPSSNTAEWNFIVSQPGRYSVWLSTATKDTMNLQYPNSVRINLLDEYIEGKPVGDKIVLNSRDVSYPYYRADSYMGTRVYPGGG